MDPIPTQRPRTWFTGPLLLYRLIHSLVSLVVIHVMSTLIRRFSKRIDYIDETRAPLDTDGARPQGGFFEKEVSEIHELVVKPAFAFSDLPAYWDAVRHVGGVGINDRKLLLEKLIVLMSRLKDTELSKKLQQALIDLLYKDLPHPPSGYLGMFPATTPNIIAASSVKIKYAYRSADGSNNNVLFPTLGQAGSPYARSVPSKRISPKSALPDPGLIFDTLLKREQFVPHPGGISALFFAFADLVIHSIFNTNPIDWTINDASSYLDLSVLYGSSEQQVQSVRRKDGSGKLWDDVFADGRLLHMPPASCALLVLLNRNHNYIAQRILDINENSNLRNPFPADETAKMAQDDEIFQRTRLVNCGYFMHIILGDYVGAILGLARDGSDWRLDPLMTMRELGHEFAPTGRGNVVSVEFNLLYRWHATLSQPDTEWTNEMISQTFDGKDFSDITVADFAKVAPKVLIPPGDLKTWEFGNIKRLDGRFRDADLANILHNSTEARAGAFQAKGIPEALRVIEIMGIQQSRTWGTCTLNEFRKFLGLKPYSDFKEWNPDHKIHTAAAALYKDIDNLELHVGLQAEEAKESGPGAGLCPGYTISRAILSDAVCLTRGDRFMTTEMNPFNLTSWGYHDCQYDTKDGSYGGLLTKLLFRTLPDYYPRGTAYAHFPFLDPVYMKHRLETTNPGLVDKYTWERPAPPKQTFPVVTYQAAKQVLTSPGEFVSAYETRLFEIAKPVLTKRLAKDTLRSSDKKKAAFIAAQKTLTKGTIDISKYIFANPPEDISTLFAKKADALIKAKSFPHVGKPLSYVDIVKDVINLLPIHWISQDIAGLPLKCASNPSGAWYEQDVYDMFSEISRYVYLNLDPVHDWHLRESGQSHGKEIIEFIKGNVDRVDSWVSLSDSQNHLGIEGYNSHVFLKKLWQALGKKYSHREFSAQVFAAVIPTAALFSQAVANVVNFYLDKGKASERKQIVDLAKSSDEEATRKVMGYVYEALRLNPPVAGVYRMAAQDIDLGAIQFQAGDHAFVNIADANLDPTVFGEKDSSPNYARTADKSGIIEFGEHGLLTSKFFEATVPGVLGVILSLKDLQRGPGKSGLFARFDEDIHGAPTAQYINLKGLVTPWPDSLIVQYTHQ